MAFIVQDIILFLIPISSKGLIIQSGGSHIIIIIIIIINLVCVTNLWTWDIELGGKLRLFLLWLSMIWMTLVADKTTGILTVLFIWHCCLILKTISWNNPLIKFVIIIIIIIIIIITIIIFIQAKLIPLPHDLRRVSAPARFFGFACSYPAAGALRFVSCECLCCPVEISASGWSLFQRSPTECGVFDVCDLEAL